MATAGTSIDSPRTRQRITFLRTAAETGGEAVELEAVLRPGAIIPPHVHVGQQERWEIVDGTATFRLRGKKLVAQAGEVVTVPQGARHALRNKSQNDVRAHVTLTPALRVEDLFEQMFRLAADGKTNRIGAPGPLRVASLIREFREEFFYLPGVPVALQRLLAGARP
jgi:quercetin dioxygenase-like cupin family protein